MKSIKLWLLPLLLAVWPFFVAAADAPKMISVEVQILEQSKPISNATFTVQDGYSKAMHLKPRQQDDFWVVAAPRIEADGRVALELSARRSRSPLYSPGDDALRASIRLKDGEAIRLPFGEVASGAPGKKPQSRYTLRVSALNL